MLGRFDFLLNFHLQSLDSSSLSKILIYPAQYSITEKLCSVTSVLLIAAKVAVELAKSDFIQSAVLLHPYLVTVDDIEGSFYLHYLFSVAKSESKFGSLTSFFSF